MSGNAKAVLRENLKDEYNNYITTKKHYIRLLITGDEDLMLWKYMRAIRFIEYYRTINCKILELFWERRKNRIGMRLGIYAHAGCLGQGTRIWHSGSIVVHRNAVVGKSCQLHGNNCIGNKGSSNSGVPVIGQNVNIGFGATIVGNITIADNVTIAANAVVTKPCSEKGAVLAGVPAKVIGYR